MITDETRPILGIPIPPMLERVLGFTNPNNARHLTIRIEKKGSEVILADGTGEMKGNFSGSMTFLTHPVIAKVMKDVPLGLGGDAEMNLVVDLKDRTAFLVEYYETFQYSAEPNAKFNQAITPYRSSMPGRDMELWLDGYEDGQQKKMQQILQGQDPVTVIQAQLTAIISGLGTVGMVMKALDTTDKVHSMDTNMREILETYAKIENSHRDLLTSLGEEQEEPF